MTGKGWRSEPARHSLAARGCRTRQVVAKSAERKPVVQYKMAEPKEDSYYKMAQNAKTLKEKWDILAKASRDQDMVQLSILGDLREEGFEGHEEEVNALDVIDNANWIIINLAENGGRFGVKSQRMGLKEKSDRISGQMWRVL